MTEQQRRLRREFDWKQSEEEIEEYTKLQKEIEVQSKSKKKKHKK